MIIINRFFHLEREKPEKLSRRRSRAEAEGPDCRNLEAGLFLTSGWRTYLRFTPAVCKLIFPLSYI